MHVGFIGVGTMGMPMARRLLAHGFVLSVWARRHEAMIPLLAAGARGCESTAQVAASSDVIITMVTDTHAVEEVVLGKNGVTQGARPGSLLIDHSTIDPEGARRVARELQARGIEMLDAPVSGGSAAAQAGTLAIMVGGSKASLQRATPALSCYAKSIVYIGSNGAGQIAKACNQICTIVNQLGAAEAMLLAERAGVDPRAVTEALMGGFAASRMLELQAPKMIDRNFDGQIESRLHDKDIRIVLNLARSLDIELPASAAAATVLEQLQRQGGAHHDAAAIFSVLDSAHPRKAAELRRHSDLV